MSKGILILGPSGSGKSTSLRNLDPKETFIINVVGKDLPFKGYRKNYTEFNKNNLNGNLVNTSNADQIEKTMQYISNSMKHIKTIIVDDSQYIMSTEFMERAAEKGFSKFTEIAQNIYKVFKASFDLRSDLIVVFLSHSDDEKDSDGNRFTKIKTVGRMIDQTITLEGLFTIVLLTSPYKKETGEIEHAFITNNDGSSVAKSPMGMFELKIPNDLKYVFEKMEEYYS
jgi:adenylate kinase family enzyme